MGARSMFQPVGIERCLRFVCRSCYEAFEEFEQGGRLILMLKGLLKKAQEALLQPAAAALIAVYVLISCHRGAAYGSA